MTTLSQRLTESMSFLVSLSTHLFVLVVLALFVSTQPAENYIELSGVYSEDGGSPAEILEELKTPEVAQSVEFMTAEDVTAESSTAEQLAITPDQLGMELAPNANLPDLDVTFALLSASKDPNAVSLKLTDFAAGGGGASLADAYRQAQADIAKQLGRNLKTLQGWKSGKIVVVKGQYDKMERVLDMYRVRYRLVDNVLPYDLENARVLLINCGAKKVNAAILHNFVQKGGFVVSTDWVVTNIAQAFPKDLGRAPGASANETVQVEFYDKGQRLMEGVRGSDGRGSWWLDGSSHFVEIRSASVSPLVTSEEMGKRYKTSDVVACVLYSGEGQLLHVVSHVFLESGDHPGIVAMHRLIFNFLLEVDQPVRR